MKRLKIALLIFGLAVAGSPTIQAGILPPPIPTAAYFARLIKAGVPIEMYRFLGVKPRLIDEINSSMTRVKLLQGALYALWAQILWTLGSGIKQYADHRIELEKLRLDIARSRLDAVKNLQESLENVHKEILNQINQKK